jgi:hypothetical protein
MKTHACVHRRLETIHVRVSYVSLVTRELHDGHSLSYMLVMNCWCTQCERAHYACSKGPTRPRRLHLQELEACGPSQREPPEFYLHITIHRILSAWHFFPSCTTARGLRAREAKAGTSNQCKHESYFDFLVLVLLSGTIRSLQPC